MEYFSIKTGIVESRPFITGQIDANDTEDLENKLSILKKEGWEPISSVCNGRVKHSVKYFRPINRRDVPCQNYLVIKIKKYLN